jgi:hypothetical protein
MRRYDSPISWALSRERRWCTRSRLSRTEGVAQAWSVRSAYHEREIGPDE